MQDVENALFVIEKTKEVGRMNGVTLAAIPGWNRVKASRYLTKLSSLGWLERVNPGKGFPTYVLGRKVLDLAPEFKL